MSLGIIKTIRLFLYVLLVGTPLFYVSQTVYPYVFSKMLFFQAVVECIVALWIPLVIFEKKYRPRFTPITLGLIAFFGVVVLAALLGANPMRSFWSTQERSFGVVTLLHCAFLALVISSLYEEISFKKFLYASLGVAAFVDCLAFLQLTIPNLLLNETIGGRPGATFGNPTFFAGYLAFHIFLAFYFFLATYEGGERRGVRRFSWARALFLGAFLLNLSALFVTQTRGDILGVLLGFGALLLLFAFRPPEIGTPFFRKRSTYRVALVLAFCFVVIFWFTRSSALWGHVPGIRRFQNISFSGEELQPRLIALRAAWEGFKERPILGWGWDNFNIVFNAHYDPRSLRLNYGETRFDKPHDVLMEYLVVGGAPLLLAFFFLVGALGFSAWRVRDRLLGQTMIAAIVAHVAQGVFVFDTLGPFLMFVLVLGVIDGAYRNEQFFARSKDLSDGRNQETHKQVRRLHRGASDGYIGTLGFSVLFFILVIYVVNIRSFEAVSDQFWGFNYLVNRKPARAIESFRSAIEVGTPYTWNIRRDYAVAIADVYFNNHKDDPTIVSREEAWNALHAMEAVIAEHPHDAYNHYAIVDLYNQVYDIDPEQILSAAEREAKRALELSPNRQEIYFSWAKTKTLKGDYDGALELLRHAVLLDDMVPDSHFYYGIVAFAKAQTMLDAGKGDELRALQALGYGEVLRAQALGRKWKNANEARVIGNYLADYEKYGEAITRYQESLALESDQNSKSALETKIKLGVAYFFSGDRAQARHILLDVVRVYDLTKSPNYQSLLPIFRELGVVVP